METEQPVVAAPADEGREKSEPTLVEQQQTTQETKSEQSHQHDAQLVEPDKSEDQQGDQNEEDANQAILLPQADEQQPPKEAASQDRIDDDGFVIIDPDNSYLLEKHKASFFAQMEKYLVDQVALCSYYKKLYEDQQNGTLANMFSAHLSNSKRDLDLITVAIKNNQNLPKYRLETVAFNGLPVNVDVKEKELQLIIRTSKLPVSEGAQVYAIGEFSFSVGDQPVSSIVSRWFHHVKVEPKNLICCSVDASRQLDIVYSTDSKPFTNPTSEWLEFDRPMLFTVTKGKSRTHKRKFKPIKLTFFERTNFLKYDKKIGAIQLKVDSINDEARIRRKQVIMNGRKDTGAFADIQIKVWKPLVDTSIRAHEEKLIILS